MHARLAVADFGMALVVVVLASPAAADDAPWRLQSAVGAPGAVRFGLQQRVRFEHLEDDYRAGAGADANALVLRTLVTAAMMIQPIELGFEFQDSRAYADDDASINTSSVNALELLQAHVAFDRENVWTDGDRLRARLGRLTLDVGSRRLVARNRFRNTINSFSGLDADWSVGSASARFFAVVPVTRLPSSADDVEDNSPSLDEENFDSLLWGVGFVASQPWAGTDVEMYLLGLHERDGDLPSRNRQLLTPGIRLLRRPAPATTDFEVEVAAQAGHSRASSAEDDTRDLDHLAYFLHGQIGHTLGTAWFLRPLAQLDIASGDHDPDDDSNQRFDTLFGARRWEFGPTGIYGPFARGNLISPGGRIVFKPHSRVTAFVAYRGYWLQARRDGWIPAGLRDPAGDSGRFLGQQVEARARIHALPGNLVLEVGAAQLFRGDFAKRAPDGATEDSTYFYVQGTVTL